MMGLLNAHGRDMANAVIGMIADTCARIEICGSIRRGKDVVKDAEVVAMPKDLTALLIRLDRLVLDRALYKAIYGYANGTKPMHRWGERYRGVLLHPPSEDYTSDFKVEIFLANKHNWGYIQWLRTGDGLANQWIMGQLMNRPLRFKDGYAEYNGRRVSMPDEETLFEALGMPFIEPKDRMLSTYDRLYKAYAPPEWFEGRYIEAHAPMVQKGLFDS